MADFKFDPAGMRRLEQQVKRKLDAATKRAHERARNADDLKRTLPEELRKIGVEPDEVKIARLVDEAKAAESAG